NGLGVTAIDWITGAVTVSVMDPETEPEVALMVAEPTATAVTVPPLTVAVAVALDAQVAVAVRSVLLPSEYIPVAVSFCVSPAATDAPDGETAIELSVGSGGGE